MCPLARYAISLSENFNWGYWITLKGALPAPSKHLHIPLKDHA